MSDERDQTVDRLQQRLTMLVRRVGVPRAHEAVVARAGVDIDVVEAVALSRIVDEGSIRLSDLAQRLSVGCSTAGRHAARLADRGLCAREDDPVDARAVVVAPTTAGRDLIARLRAAHREVLEELLASWTTGELDLLSDLLGRLGDDLGTLTAPATPTAATT